MTEPEVREAVLLMIREVALAALYEVRANPKAYREPKPKSAVAWFKAMGGDDSRARGQDPEDFAQALATRLTALICIRLPQDQRTLAAIKDEIGAPS